MQGNLNSRPCRFLNHPIVTPPQPGLLCIRLLTPSTATLVKAVAVSLAITTKKDPSAAKPSVAFLRTSVVSCDDPGLLTEELCKGEENSRGSNQLPSKSKKHELAHEQDEQKRTIRRAEQ